MADQMLKAQRMGRVVDNNTMLPELYAPQFVNSELNLDHFSKVCVLQAAGVFASTDLRARASRLMRPMLHENSAFP